MSVHATRAEARHYIYLFEGQTLYHIAGERIFHTGNSGIGGWSDKNYINAEEVRRAISDLQEMLALLEVQP